MTRSRLKLVIVGLVAAGACILLLTLQVTYRKLLGKERTLQEQQEQIAKLTAENERLSGLLAQAKDAAMPSLPAPALNESARQSGGNFQGTNLFATVQGEHAKLKNEEVERYVESNGRSAASLLAAYRTTGSAAWLEEAMQKNPNNPLVAFEAAFRKDVPAEERRQWLDAFKKAAPDNALADYLSAREYFKAGQSDRGLQEVMAAAGKRVFDDYTLERIQNDEEAYRAAGYSMAEAKLIPSSQLLLPQLFELKQLSGNLVDMAGSYQQAGETASAQAALQMALTLGQRYSSVSAGEPEISHLVGLAIERNALAKMDPNSSYGDDGLTVKERLDQVSQYSDTLRNLNSRAESLFPLLSEQDWISYKDRWRVFGEQAALRWVIEKYGQN